LFNHRFMAAMIDQEYARSQRYNRPLSFILLQLDENAPERVQAILAELRTTLSSLLRDTDTLGHWGPGPARFAVILPETAPEGAAIILSRLEVAPLIARHLQVGLASVVGGVSHALDLPGLAEANLRIRAR
jgi:GGDEF domain-containing protein